MTWILAYQLAPRELASEDWRPILYFILTLYLAFPILVVAAYYVVNSLQKIRSAGDIFGLKKMFWLYISSLVPLFFLCGIWSINYNFGMVYLDRCLIIFLLGGTIDILILVKAVSLIPGLLPNKLQFISRWKIFKYYF